MWRRKLSQTLTENSENLSIPKRKSRDFWLPKKRSEVRELPEMREVREDPLTLQANDDEVQAALDRLTRQVPRGRRSNSGHPGAEPTALHTVPKAPRPARSRR